MNTFLAALPLLAFGLILTIAAYVRFLKLAHSPAGSLPVIEATIRIRKMLTTSTRPIQRVVAVVDILVVLATTIGAALGKISPHVPVALVIAATACGFSGWLARAVFLAAAGRIAHANREGSPKALSASRRAAITIAFAVAGPALLLGVIWIPAAVFIPGAIGPIPWITLAYAVLTRAPATLIALKRLNPVATIPELRTARFALFTGSSAAVLTATLTMLPGMPMTGMTALAMMLILCGSFTRILLKVLARSTDLGQN